jgi:cytochrome c biogenesis protein CcdA
MKRGKLVLLVFFLILFSGFAFALEKDCVYYFYGEGDSRSEMAGIFLEELQSKYSSLNINKFEVYYDKTNLKLLQDYFDAYQVPMEKQGVPIIFLAQSYFVGERPITEYLENAVISNEDLSCPSLKEKGALGIIGEKSPKHLIETLTFFTITGAAIVDSLDSCALAILLILLGILLIIEKRKKLLKGGISFIAGIYAAYFFLGTKMLGAFTKGYYFHKIVGGLAIILGLTIVWYLWKGKIFFREIQEKKGLRKAIKEMSSPAAIFLIGFTLSLFGFSLVRKYFSVISGLAAEKITRWAAMPLLLYYNLIFILPLILVVSVFYYSLKKMKKHEDKEERGAEKRREKDTRLLHLLVGIIMVVLGLVVFF